MFTPNSLTLPSPHPFPQGEWILVCLCMAESLCYSPETVTPSSISCTRVCVQNKKSKKKSNLTNLTKGITFIEIKIFSLIKKKIYLKGTQHIYQRKQWHPTPIPLPEKSHGRRSLAGCSPWGLCESGTTERLHFPFSLSFIGEGNGNPLQYSCLENPRDGGAWQAAIYGVAQSRT